MGENWAAIAAEAGAGIAEVGQTASIVRHVKSGAAHNPTIAKQSYNCTVSVMAFKNSEIDGTLIQRGDKLVYLSTVGLAIEPTVADRITIGGQEHSIIAATPLSPTGTVVFWKIQARK